MIAYLVGKGFKNYKLGDDLPDDARIINIIKNSRSQNIDNPNQAISISLRPKDHMKFLLKTLNGLYSPILQKTDQNALGKLQ
jgi:hypothetical protein